MNKTNWSIHKNKAQNQETPTTTPSARNWLFNEHRLELGYEALARKNVVCFFSLRPNKYPTNSSNFGWPEKKITSKGPFWTNSASYTEVERLLNISQKINPSILFNKPKIKKFINGQIIYDNNNKIFSTLINNILNKKW